MSERRTRFTAKHPCPVCDGYDRMDRGHGKRCFGYLWQNGEGAVCTREEYAGSLQVYGDTKGYLHLLVGECECGQRHDPRPQSANGHANGKGPLVVATYDYRDAAGNLLFQCVRYAPKSFKQRRPDGAGGWLWKLGDVERVLYRLPELLAADPAEPVVVVEGEKDADALCGLGFVATTSPMGAGKWRKSYAESLRGRDVVVIGDNDDEGRGHAKAVAHSLQGVARSARVIELDALREHGDVSDWLEAGHTAEELRERIDEVTPHSNGRSGPAGHGTTATAQSSVDRGHLDGGDWDAPIPLVAQELPAFPVDALPSWVAEQVKAVARFTQTPPDLAAMLGLSTLAVPCAKKVRIEVKSGYTEPANVSTATAMVPGSRKTAVFAAMVAPLEEWEEEQARAMEPIIAKARTEYDILEAALKKAKTDAANAKAAEREAKTKEATELARRLAETKIPEAPRLIADDCSPEKLASLLHTHGGRLALLSPEGDVFDLMAGRYGNGPNLGVYLKGHAGDTLRVDRIGRPPEYVRQPALTQGLAVQPDVLSGLMHLKGFRGRGLLGRYVYALPANLMGGRDTTAPPVPADTAGNYRRALQVLLDLPFAVDHNGQPSAWVVKLGPAAQQRLAAFEKEIEPQLARDGALGGMTDWGGKLVGAVARISLLLHMAEHVARPEPWKVPVAAATVENAIKIGRYATAHAKVAYAVMGGDEAVEGARHVLAWIENTDQTIFSQRDAHRALQARFERADAVKAALDVLEERGYVRQQPQEQREGRGRHKSPRYDVNPSVHQQGRPANSVNTSIMSEGSADEAGAGENQGEMEEVRL